MLRVILSGALANKPHNGGNAWVMLSWAHGLKKLGYEVLLLEQISAKACVDRRGRQTSFFDSSNLHYFQSVVDRYLPGDAVLICSTGECWGATRSNVLQAAKDTDVLVNISGHLQDERLIERIERKVFVDLDPGFTQFWFAQGTPAAPLDGYEMYCTVGENIGLPECEIPTCGFNWRPIRQPVICEEWISDFQPHPTATFNTVASWRGSYGGITYNGRSYGVKAHEFRRFLDLPTLVREPFAIALEIYPGDHIDRENLINNQWELIDPCVTLSSPAGFRDFVFRSKGEFSAAQGVYVHTNSGWFSDRTTRYLAAGRPVLVQDTGFGRNLPTGEGLLKFGSLDEAVDGVEAINAQYARHCLAARDIAHEYFDASIVLTHLIEEVNCLC